MKPEAEITLTTIGRETLRAAEEILKQADLKPKQIFVVGCSTSEVQGMRLGTEGSEVVAARILNNISKIFFRQDVYLAVQCCEHLNRALVVERAALEKYHLTEVMVVPVLKAGGAMAAQAMRDFSDPVVVEAVAAHAGIDIGGVLIGMHLRPVAVPLKLKNKLIGKAPVIAAGTRPKLIGGCRAVYE